MWNDGFMVWILLALVLLLLFVNWLMGAKWGERAPSYRVVSSLLTDTETRFLHVMEQALGPEYRICAKVRVADVLLPTAKDRSAWRSDFNRITQKHFDFVVCSVETWDILFAVELDDASHSRRDRIRRDVFLNTACNSAGFALHRVPVQRSYSADTLRAKLLQLPIAA